MKKEIIISIIIAITIILTALIISQNKKIVENETDSKTNNVSIVEGKQIIEINVRGGYQPRKSFAKSGITTIIRFNTKNTFDCSSSVRIPSMNIYKMLPQNGSTDIDLGISTVGKLNGSCGMGMYNFEIDFK